MNGLKPGQRYTAKSGIEFIIDWTNDNVASGHSEGGVVCAVWNKETGVCLFPEVPGAPYSLVIPVKSASVVEEDDLVNWRPWTHHEVPLGTEVYLKSWNHPQKIERTLLLHVECRDNSLVTLGGGRRISLQHLFDRYCRSIDDGRTFIPCGQRIPNNQTIQ